MVLASGIGTCALALVEHACSLIALASCSACCHVIIHCLMASEDQTTPDAPGAQPPSFSPEQQLWLEPLHSWPCRQLVPGSRGPPPPSPPSGIAPGNLGEWALIPSVLVSPGRAWGRCGRWGNGGVAAVQSSHPYPFATVACRWHAGVRSVKLPSKPCWRAAPLPLEVITQHRGVDRCPV